MIQKVSNTFFTVVLIVSFSVLVTIVASDSQNKDYGPYISYPYQPEEHGRRVFCGNEQQGFVALYVNDNCNDYITVTVAEFAGFRSEQVPPSLVVVPGSVVNSRIPFMKRYQDEEPLPKILGKRNAPSSEQNRKREVELVESGNFGSNRYSVSERLGARFTVRNLSIGSNYSVFMQRCLDKSNVKLFAALNIQCCTPFDIPMEPQFTGEDAQTPEDRRKVEAQSEAISIAMVILLISSLVLYLMFTMIRSEVRKHKRMKKNRGRSAMIEASTEKERLPRASTVASHYYHRHGYYNDQNMHYRYPYKSQ
ncbi:uncharacterized protein LOC142339925 [Convolutriloba macropyga]|uniref:uncharacterized protein LOC142339925 n=1 Tax=Convolutriloba macropyga TaxID=536237 RepID=UPI003F51ADD1